MVSIVAVAALVVTGVSILLAVVSALAVARTRAWRFAFASLAFCVFALRGVLIVGDGVGWLSDPIAWDTWTVGMDAVIVASIYAAIVKG